MSRYRQILIPEADSRAVEEGVLILDLRDHLSYRCGHITNAINLGEDNLYPILGNMNKSLPIIFYCNSKTGARNMAKLFSGFGFTQCFYLKGSFEDWLLYQESKANLPEHLCSWLVTSGFTSEDINQRGFNGETPLMTAARKGQIEYLVELINHGAILDLVNNDGNSAVWLACYSNNIYVLLALAQAGANLDIQNDNGASPLIYAASAGRLEMVQLLLQAGANINLATFDGFSALDVAATLAILKLLRHADKGEIFKVEPLHYLKTG